MREKTQNFVAYEVAKKRGWQESFNSVTAYENIFE